MKLATRRNLRILPLLFNILFLKSKANRQKKMPDYYKVAERNYFLQKSLSNILRHLNIKLDVEGFENVPNGPCLLIPNHSTYADALIMWSALWNHGDGKKQSKIVNFIAREEVKAKKTIRQIAELGDTYFIDTNKPIAAMQTLLEFGKFIKKNKSCGVIFAEGTRTKDGKLGTFNTGAVRLAQSTYLPIIPVTINNAVNALDWKREGELIVKVTFHNMLKPIQFQTVDPKSLTENIKEIIASNYIDQVVTSKETVKNSYTSRKTKK
ncbi:lysophospholipid acyltransferase family protein [Metamycoplasma equirhinis]|uniref:lysophospholipid acyltransferase family protein n=1 Tax=Metamycoplasma equirhinis TaxID=92402 RepID=UPI003593A648